jgi:redox-sensitive bicupin YhaK (pirin superfamily)
VSMPAGRSFEQPVPRGHAAFAYVFEGEAILGTDAAGAGTPVAAVRLALLGDGEIVGVRTADRAARLLLVSGRPLGEPVARHGPFVMNTRDEIQQALRELREGTFIKA